MERLTAPKRAKEKTSIVDKKNIILVVVLMLFVAIVFVFRPREAKLDGPDFNESSYGDFIILSERSGIRGNKIIELADNEENTYILLTDKDYNPISITKNKD